MPRNHRPVPRWGALISLASSQCSFNRTFFGCHGAECLAWWSWSSCLFVDTTENENSALDIAAHQRDLVCLSPGGLFFWGATNTSRESTMYPKAVQDLCGWRIRSLACGYVAVCPREPEGCPLPGVWDTPGEVLFCLRVLLSLSGHRTH